MRHAAVAKAPGQIGQDLCHGDGMVAIVKQAQEEADRLINDAKMSAKEIRLGAKAYANDVLEELENYLGRTGEQVKKSREQFSK